MARPKKSPEAAPAPVVKVKRPGRPRKVQETPAAEVDLMQVRTKVIELYGETQWPRSDCDFSGHDLAKKVGYIERGLEELMDILSIHA